MASKREIITHDRIMLRAIIRDAGRRLKTAETKVDTGHGKAIELALVRVQEALEAAIHQTGKLR